MENVQGLITSRKGKDFEKVVSEFKDAGFVITGRVVDMSLYGVPQARKRVILVGVREGMRFEFPEPSKKPMSLRQALGLRGQYATKKRPGATNWQGMRWLDVEKPGYTVGTKDNYDLLMPADDVARAEVEAMRVRGGRRASKDGSYRLNSEELKVIQGVPGYVLQGKGKERHYAVGNMVPAPLAEAVGKAIKKALEGR